MKVVCIDDTPPKMPFPNSIFPNGFVVKNEVYTVLQFCDTKTHVKNCYILKEKPIVDVRNGKEDGWQVTRFVPLDYWNSEFDVTEEIPELVGAEI